MLINEVDKMIMLVEEIGILRSRLQEHDTGHINTAINVLEDRVEEIKDRVGESKHEPKHHRL